MYRNVKTYRYHETQFNGTSAVVGDVCRFHDLISVATRVPTVDPWLQGEILRIPALSGLRLHVSPSITSSSHVLTAGLGPIIVVSHSSTFAVCPLLHPSSHLRLWPLDAQRSVLSNLRAVSHARDPFWPLVKPPQCSPHAPRSSLPYTP